MGGKQGAGPLNSILVEFVNQGLFDNAFIADENGLPLICAGANMASSETQAAVFARINKTVAMVDAQKGLGVVDEMVFNISDKKKIVCRNFDINKKHLILAITMDSHRRYK
ncbi:MAG: hypothetical protein WCF08_06665, partial [Anaerolineaceae bacterium]